MASPSVEQRIIRELSRRGTCSLLDLKSSLRLSRGDIMGITARLANQRSVRIKKDHQGEHINYTWTGPKEKTPGGKSSPAKKPPPSLPAQAVVSNVTSPRASRAKKSTEPIPADWKQRLEQSISGNSLHPDKQGTMLRLLEEKEVEEAANLIWSASRKVNPKWDASVFFGHFQEVLLRLAISKGLRRLTVTNFRTMAEALEMIRDNELFSRKGPAREELERSISILRHRAENTSKTKPEFPGPRWALQTLLQYFREYLQKPLYQATWLLMVATFGWKGTAKTVGVRASEWAGWKDVSGLKKATAADTTKEVWKEAWAALDKLNGEELEAAFEKMSTELQDLYLGK